MTKPKFPDKKLPPGPPSQFKGGSIVKAYRLPADPEKFEQADKAIKKVLDKFKNK